MRKWILIGAAALLAASGEAPREATAACAPTMRVGGEVFTGLGTRRTLPLAGRVKGVQPACNDTPGGGRDEQDTEVELRRIRGVSAKLAVADPRQDRLAYVARGTFPQVRTHPLSRYLRRRDSEPAKCRDRRTLAGRVTATPDGGFFLRVQFDSGNADLNVHRGTIFRGGRRLAGQPRIVENDRFTATLQTCAPHPSETEPRLFADVIRAR